MLGLFEKIKEGFFTYPSWFTSEQRGFIGSLLIQDPLKRLTMTEVKQHPWVNPSSAPTSLAAASGTSSARLAGGASSRSVVIASSFSSSQTLTVNISTDTAPQPRPHRK